MDSLNLFLNQDDSLILIGKMILEEVRSIRRDYEAEIISLTNLLQKFISMYVGFKSKHVRQDHSVIFDETTLNEELNPCDNLSSINLSDVSVSCLSPMKELLERSSLTRLSAIEENEVHTPEVKLQNTDSPVHSACSAKSDLSDGDASNHFGSDDACLTDGDDNNSDFENNDACLECDKKPDFEKDAVNFTGKNDKKSHIEQMSLPDRNIEVKTDIKSESNDEENISKPKQWPKRPCPICGKTLHASIMQTHIRTHTGEKTHKCNVCGKRFITKACLKQHHTAIHTDEKLFMCKICDKTFSRRSVCNHHIKSHTGYKYNCKYCGKSFRNPWLVKRHEVSHTGEKPYGCKQCDKAFSQQGALKQHMRRHTGDVHGCDLCDKSFLSKWDLIRHMRCHTKEKPFQCKVCKVSFSLKGTLKTHMKTHGATTKNKL